MIICPNCKHNEVEGALFCSDCGAQLINVRMMATQDLPSSSPGLNQPVTERRGTAPVRTTSSLESCLSLHFVESGQILHLSGRSDYTLGRVTEGQPILPDVDLTPYEAYGQGVSRLHATLKVTSSRVFISDLGSSNGTRVNGQKITPHKEVPLNHGDVVALGKLKIQFLIRK